jgi:branched-chain amino acid transport system substrate-binding protein
MGRQAEAALRLFASDVDAGGSLSIGGRRYRLALECHDDRSEPSRAAEIYRILCGEKRADLIFGPYSSRLARVAAAIVDDAGMVMINHGGASDELYDQHYRLIVGILTPAGDYLVPFARLLSTLKFWRKRVAIVSSKTPFARDVANGFERACRERWARRRGVRVRLKYAAAGADRSWERLFPALKRSRINALVTVGSFDEDIALMRALISDDSNIPVLACVAAGVTAFGDSLGEEAEGIVGPSGWEPESQIAPEVGPPPKKFASRMRAVYSGPIDYPAAQAYAAGLLTLAALKAADAVDQERLRAAFADLRTSTLYGDFAIDRVTGRQIGHKMLLVQWHRGQKVIIEPEAHREAMSHLEFPSGWRLLLSSFQKIRLGHPDDREDGGNEEDEGG